MDQRQRAELYLKQSPTKRQILSLLQQEPRYLSELARELDMTAPSMFQHAEELAELGLVTKEQVGKAFLLLTQMGRELSESS